MIPVANINRKENVTNLTTKKSTLNNTVTYHNTNTQKYAK